MAYTDCPAGWSQDPFRTAAGSPCVITTRWLEVTVAASAAGWGLFASAASATIVVLRSSGEAWSSPRVRVYTMWQLAALLIAVGSANLASELDDALTDPRAAWRALWFVGVGLIWTVVTPLLFWHIVFEPALQFVGGLDLAHSQQA